MRGKHHGQRDISFQRPLQIGQFGSSEKGINWADWHTEYKELRTVITEVVLGFAHLYAYNVSKVTFPSNLTGRTIHKLEYVNCPPTDAFHHIHRCTLPCHKFTTFACATKTAHSLYEWLMHYKQTKDYVQCPPDVTQRTSDFIAAP